MPTPQCKKYCNTCHYVSECDVGWSELVGETGFFHCPNCCPNYNTHTPHTILGTYELVEIKKERKLP